MPVTVTFSPFMSFVSRFAGFQSTYLRVANPVMRTLVVDDEPIARQVLRDELSGFEDVEVTGEAGNGEEALEQIIRLKPDLVLLDLQMPGLGGFEVIRRLPEGALPVIIIV